jgi:hypothetical protein
MSKLALLAFCALAVASSASAQSSCSATNDNNDQTCSITCATGQSALCSNATGGGTPSCQCLDSVRIDTVKRLLSAKVVKVAPVKSTKASPTKPPKTP